MEIIFVIYIFFIFFSRYLTLKYCKMATKDPRYNTSWWGWFIPVIHIAICICYIDKIIDLKWNNETKFRRLKSIVDKFTIRFTKITDWFKYGKM